MKHMDVSLASDSHLLPFNGRIVPCVLYNLPGKEKGLGFICCITNMGDGNKKLNVLVIETHQNCTHLQSGSL